MCDLRVTLRHGNVHPGSFLQAAISAYANDHQTAKYSLSVLLIGEARLDHNHARLAEPVISLLRTTPTLLLSGTLDPAGKGLRVRLELPFSLPPTFRGKFVRYSYAFSVSAHVEGTPDPTTLKVPFCLIPGPEAPPQQLHEMAGEQLYGFGCDSSAPLRIEAEEVPADGLSWPALSEQIQLAPPRPASYSIQSSDGLIVRVALPRVKWWAGELIEGFLDFDGGVVPCHSAQVMLVMVEQPSSLWTKNESPRPFESVVAECHLQTRDCLRCPIALCLPEHAAPSFSSSHVTVSWQLRFCLSVVDEVVPMDVRVEEVRGLAGATIAIGKVVAGKNKYREFLWSLPFEVCVR